MQDYYENWKKTTSARRMMSQWVLDPDGILTGNGYCEGIYEIRFVNPIKNISTSAYIGQAGNDQTAPSYVAKDIYERILQHLKRWMGGNYFEYWTGLSDKDTDWKIELHMLAEEKNHSDRLKKESEFISQNKPFMQDTANGTFDLYPTKYGYKRNDLCIHPWTRDGESEGQRRLAFLHRIKNIEKSM